MNRVDTYKWLNYLFAIIWLINGLYCKILNAVPRHQDIVARILGHKHAEFFTFLIGCGEIGIAVWIISKYYKNQVAWFQIGIIVLMNIIEFILAPDLLLWGRANIVFALLFAALIYYVNFYLPYAKRKEAACTPF